MAMQSWDLWLRGRTEESRDRDHLVKRPVNHKEARDIVEETTMGMLRRLVFLAVEMTMMVRKEFDLVYLGDLSNQQR